MEQSRARPFTNGFLNDFLGATSSSIQDTENWAPRRGLLAVTEKRKTNKSGGFWNIFSLGELWRQLYKHSEGSCMCSYAVGSTACQVTLSHDRKLCYPASPQFLLKDLPPCLSPPVGITSLGIQGQVPDSGAAQSFVAFEECHVWDLQLPF